MTTVDAATLRALSDIAVRAALAGTEVVRASGGPGNIEAKGAGDYVSDVDRRSEDAVARLLRGQTPEIPVLGEETGGPTGNRYWAVDPLDGTANFLHGFPVVGVSVALVAEGRPVVGAVSAPFLDLLFVAVRGGGAELRDGSGSARRLRTSDREPGAAIVATGFPFRDKTLVARYVPAFERCFERFEDLRRAGAAALDLAWVAAGVFDGFFELNLSPWDVAAGALLVQEAGGRVSDWAGGGSWLDSGDILAGSPAVHAALLEVARGGRSSDLR